MAFYVGMIVFIVLFCVCSGKQQISLQVDVSDVDYEIMREREEAMHQLEVG